MNCEYCARRIRRSKLFIVITPCRRTKIGYAAAGPEYAFCSRECASRAVRAGEPFLLSKVGIGKHLPAE